VPHAAKSPATVNADFATTIIIRASEIVAGAAADQGDNPNAFEALQKARDEFVAGHLHRDEKGRTYGWPQLVNDLRRYLEAHGIVAPGTWGNITRWSTATNHNQVARILRESAPQISKLVYDRTEAATAFELMDEKRRSEHLLMKRAAAFLSEQGLEVEIQWEREDPDAPLDFRGTIDRVPWAFELKALRKDPNGYHRKLGHPNERRSLEQQLEALAQPLPQVRDDTETLQWALDKAVSDAGKSSKIEALTGAKYCLVVHNYQFTYIDAWHTVTMPDLGAFDAVIVLHQDTVAPAWTWEVLRQTGIDKPLRTQNAGDLADIVEFRMSRNGMPDPKLISYAWEHLGDMEGVESEILKAFEPPARNECRLPE
jgi:hypothetical protein